MRLWWNGIHNRLKICRRKLAGSNPANRTMKNALKQGVFLVFGIEKLTKSQHSPAKTAKHKTPLAEKSIACVEHYRFFQYDILQGTISHIP